MGKPAARKGDMHICPVVDPGPKPHVGGPIAGPSAATVLAGGVPVAVVSDAATCAGPPDSVARGSSTVFVQGVAAARMGDGTSHGGVIVSGMSTVLIGDRIPSLQAAALESAARAGTPFCET